LNRSRAADSPEVEHLTRRLEAAEAALREERQRAAELATDLETRLRHIAEAMAADLEAHLRRLAESLPNLCWLTRTDGYVYWFNETYREHTGISPERAKGFGWRDFYPPDVADKLFATWREGISSGEGFTATLPLPTPTGRLKDFQVRVEPLGERRWFGVNIEPTGEATMRERLQFALAAGSLQAELRPRARRSFHLRRPPGIDPPGRPSAHA
jgi:PAS domain S-box-containing protein